MRRSEKANEINNQEYEDFLLLTKGAEAELVEKKSRFIATVRPAASEEEAAAFIDEMKKKYYDARHNCSAFVIGSKAQITRSSDDGEPGGTAGRPMLEVLLGSGIRNAAAVVTRYFGGTLLGTGGLVRAYSGVLKEALEKCETARQHFGVRITIRTDYNTVGKIQYLLAGKNINIEDSSYAADVVMTVIAPIEEYDRLCKELIEATSARVVLEEVERLYYVR
ncbi:MAG: YigZ family protein [Lachnospiraceae bacterium]|nr:YigZ family protein [Lachnospiraceae bacterium]